jgi:CBS domain containing-hemolysin-like protein
MADSAATVFTDFRRVRPFSVSAAASIGQVNDTMIACGVRLLFVTGSEGVLQGLVTYTDVYGEKPVNYLQEHGGRREEILAQDIMTPLNQLEALQQADVDRACVGDIVETLKAAGRQHMLVCETGEDGLPVITGIFSSTQVEKTLGKKIELSSRANTFADLERALA